MNLRPIPIPLDNVRTFRYLGYMNAATVADARSRRAADGETMATCYCSSLANGRCDFCTGLRSEGYQLGARNGAADRMNGYRSMLAWSDPTEYGRGYRAANTTEGGAR